MPAVNNLSLSPAVETAAIVTQGKRFGVRRAYARSADSQAHNEPGQDYLGLREDGQRLAFALCDGVSQSFMGDLAAQLLGEALVNWLWENLPSSGEIPAFRSALSDFLQALTILASQKVHDYPLRQNLSPMVRDVLERKRESGSESMFIGGRVDTISGQLTLVWMGDSRLRLWGKNGELDLDNSFQSKERWSSRRGLMGELHVAMLQLNRIERLVAYSDGLAELDDRLVHSPNDDELNQVIASAKLKPASDDISFIEVWLGEVRPIVERPPLPAPQNLSVYWQRDHLQAEWTPVPGATGYEVRLSGVNDSRLENKTRCEIPSGDIPFSNQAVRVRARQETIGGEWKTVTLPPREVEVPALVPPPSLPSFRLSRWLTPPRIIGGVVGIMGVCLIIGLFSLRGLILGLCATTTPTNQPTHTSTPSILSKLTVTPTANIRLKPTAAIRITPTNTAAIEPTLTSTPTLSRTQIPTGTSTPTPSVASTRTRIAKIRITPTGSPTLTETPTATQEGLVPTPSLTLATDLTAAP